jgi:CHASE2 domain-containing sensor protein
MFLQHATTGFANMIIDQDAAFMTVREVSFAEQCAGKREVSFPIRLAQIVDPHAAERALARGEPKEIISFHGNIESFYHVDIDQALDPSTDLSVVRGKVVLLGYCGPNFQTKSLEDNFFTPLNPQYVGRSYPDMFGVVIHANTLAMIRNNDYIGSMSSTTSIVLGFVILVLNVMLFTFMYTKYEVWYDVIAVAVQLGESLLGVFLILYVFNHYSYKLALTPTLVGVALVGTVHDLYQDSIKKIIVRTLKRVTSKSEQRT